MNYESINKEIILKHLKEQKALSELKRFTPRFYRRRKADRDLYHNRKPAQQARQNSSGHATRERNDADKQDARLQSHLLLLEKYAHCSVLEQDEKPQLFKVQIGQVIRAIFADPSGIISKRGIKQIVSELDQLLEYYQIKN